MICFDTMVLIWGVQGAARPGQEEMIDRTRRYIGNLAREHEQIMVPTPALTEYLQHFDDAERKRQLELLERHFLIAAYDLPAAYLAAGLARKAGGLKRQGDITRQAVKTDFQIIATAVVRGATRIVTDESQHFETLAAGRILVSGVPEVHEQQPLDLNP